MVVVPGRNDIIALSTLPDILPESGPMRMLILGKTPTLAHVQKKHYFEGRQGRMLWRLLQQYGVMTVPPDMHPDETLLEQGFGITNIVKTPHEFGDEPTDDEYRQAIPRVFELISKLQPGVVLFPYKRSLDTILRLRFGRTDKAIYGFNPDLEELFGTKVFAFPMPGTPCRQEVAAVVMRELKSELIKSS